MGVKKLRHAVLGSPDKSKILFRFHNKITFNEEKHLMRGKSHIWGEMI
jgi:hypothetical protein